MTKFQKNTLEIAFCASKGYKNIWYEKNSKKEKKLRKESGITLIALVITIIVLLILAGVSLNLIARTDGILNKATRGNRRK